MSCCALCGIFSCDCDPCYAGTTRDENPAPYETVIRVETTQPPNDKDWMFTELFLQITHERTHEALVGHARRILAQTK